MAELVIAIRAQNQAQAALNSVKGSIGQIQQAASNATASMRQMGDSLKNMGGTMSLAVTAPVLGFVGAALKGAIANEKLEISFTTMLGSLEKAKSMMQELSTFAAKTPFEGPEIQEAATMLLGVGFAADTIIPNLTMLGNISAGLNIPLQQLTKTFGQVKSAGVLMGGDLMQFTSAGIPLIAALAKTMGVAEGEIKKMVSRGEIGFDDMQVALASLTAEGGLFFNLMDAQSKALGGLLSSTSDYIGQIMTAIGQGIIEAFNLKGYLTNFNAQLEKAKIAIVNFAKTQPGLFKLIAIFGLIAAAIGPILVGLGILVTTLAPLAPAILAVAGAFSVLIGPIGLVIAALVALVAFDVGGIRTKFTELASVIGMYVSAVADAGFASIETHEVLENFPDFLRPAAEGFDRFTSLLGAYISAVTDAGFASVETHEVLENFKGPIGSIVRAWDAWSEAISRAEHAMGKMQGAVQTERFVQLPDPSMIDQVAQAFVRVRDALADFISTGDTSGIEAIFNSIRSAIANLDLPSISEVWELAKVEITTFVKNFTWDVPGDVFNGLKTAVMDQLRSIWDNLFGGGGGPLKGVDTKNFDDFGMRAESIFAQAIKGIDSAAGADKKNLFDPLVDSIMAQLGRIDWAGAALDTKDIFAGLVDQIWASLRTTDWTAKAKSAGEGATDLFGPLVETVWAQLRTTDWTATGAGAGAANLFAPLTDWVMQQLAGIDWATLPGDALTKLQAGATTLKDAVIGAITTFDFAIDPTQTTKLQSTLDSVKPIFDQIFGADGVLTTISGAINESMIAIGERMEKTNGKAMGEQFSTMLGGFLSVFTLFEGMKVEGSAERANAIIQLGTDVTNFLSDFGSGIDAEALATSLSGFATTFTTQLTTVFGNEENMTAIGTAAGSLASTIITKIGEFFGKPGFGEEMGEAAGGAASALATGAMSIVTGLATELGKVNWEQVADSMRSFVQGFAQGAAAAVGQIDWGPVGQAMATAVGKAITGAVGGMFPGGIFGKNMLDPLGNEAAVSDRLRGTNQLAAINWSDIIPKLTWDSFVGSVVWSSFVNPITWGSFVASLTWSSFVPRISWSSWIPDVSWSSFIPDIDWSMFLSGLGLGDAPAAGGPATGTSNFRGGLTWVGETGPEIVGLPRGSRVWSNSESEAMTGGETFTIHVETMNVRSDADIHAIAYQIDDLRRQRRPRR